ELMVRHRINRLPVIENDRVVGIVTRGDIIEGLAKL
ncbi:MAG TPA: CBS domain-containing protein, partial [Methanosarcina sp.]|nr:CBS domain-containing protein [Methanosarcina sp.]